MKKQTKRSMQPDNVNKPRFTEIEDLKLVVGGTGQVIKPIGPQPGPGG